MTVLALPDRIDLVAVSALHAALGPVTEGPTVIDASNVRHLGALGVQLLVSAALSARASGHSLTITPRSAAFDEALDRFGMTLDDLQNTEAA
ncbi:STAS domain-containing protein [Thioclava pacifica]|uniref:STAS domain-containing protein n=1 Tax=Thioclava pacifica DSM 10166 TaxID=1353537 RepID=A0A074J832_9RHOB|nr:STAS domain-containing protein [Thioclava pacifica]KEO51758.1 hypothetical protein TP2_09780 [Thioclava pacifica DSM 10166]